MREDKKKEPKKAPEGADEKDRFESLARALVKVPKSEIDEKRKKA
jgi:hypothetical protein